VAGAAVKRVGAANAARRRATRRRKKAFSFLPAHLLGASLCNGSKISLYATKTFCIFFALLALLRSFLGTRKRCAVSTISSAPWRGAALHLARHMFAASMTSPWRGFGENLLWRALEEWREGGRRRQQRSETKNGEEL